MKKHSVSVVNSHSDGYLFDKIVGNKGRKLSRKVAQKIADRLSKAGYIAKVVD